jgi:hypothetical protein
MVRTTRPSRDPSQRPSTSLTRRVALSVLRDCHATSNEPLEGFSLTKFDGATIAV